MPGHDHTPNLHEHTDQWHHHSTVEGAPQIEHSSVANPTVLIHWLVLILASGLVVIAALGMYFSRYYSMTRQDKIETLVFYETNARPKLIEAEDKLGIGKQPNQYVYHAANAQTHTVQLPIDQAMQRVVAKYQSGKTAQASSMHE